MQFYRGLIKAFCALSVATGMNELLLRTDRCSEWDAEEISTEIEGRTATDLGCCDGTFTVFYALNHSETEFIGIDISEEAVKAAEENASKHGTKNARFVCTDVMSSDADRYFSADTLIAQGAVYQFLPLPTDTKGPFLKEIKTKVRTGCKIILSQSIPPHYADRFRPKPVKGYELLRYDVNTVHDPTLNTKLASELAVFRRI